MSHLIAQITKMSKDLQVVSDFWEPMTEVTRNVFRHHVLPHDYRIIMKQMIDITSFCLCISIPVTVWLWNVPYQFPYSNSLAGSAVWGGCGICGCNASIWKLRPCPASSLRFLPPDVHATSQQATWWAPPATDDATPAVIPSSYWWQNPLVWVSTNFSLPLKLLLLAACHSDKEFISFCT